MTRIGFLGTFIMLFSLAATAAQQRAPLVCVSILPQVYFVERIAGPLVRVEALVGPGQAMETHDPSAKQVNQLTSANLYFLIGAPFEAGLQRRLASLAADVVFVDTTENVPLRTMDGHVCSAHDHHHHGHHDPHVWLSVPLVKTQTQTMFEALATLLPDHRETLEANLRGFHDELDQLHEELRTILAPVKGKRFYIYHPELAYMAADYDLEQVAVEHEGKEPTARRLGELVDQTRADDVHTLFVQPQFATKSAETLATEIGARVVSIDPLASDYIENMRAMAHALHDGMTPPATKTP